MHSSFDATLEHGQKGEWQRTNRIWSIAPYQCHTREVTGNMKGALASIAKME